MRVRITQIDGALPNLALMRLSRWHKDQGHEVHVTREIEPTLFEVLNTNRVYASAIFDFSRQRLERFTQQWPGAIIGGTGSFSSLTVEQVTGEQSEAIDYGPWLGKEERASEISTETWSANR